MTPDVLKLGQRITILPVIHGSADCALQVRRMMLEHSFDCIAVPLPESFRNGVETGIQALPTPTAAVQREQPRFRTEWSPEADDEDDDETRVSYVPIDPCQPVIAALRIAMGEHLPRYFIDLEVSSFLPYSDSMPDAYALREVPIERFAAAILPSIRRPPDGQPVARIRHMAAQLHRLQEKHESILFVCSFVDWPWIREAFVEQLPCEFEHEETEPVELYQVETPSLLFMLGELPFITALHERARAELEDDENLSIDGVKELLLASRAAYLEDFRGRARKITPHLLKVCLKYIRNLSLLERRLTPDLYTIVIAGKQIAGDQFALHVAETAGSYPYGEPLGLAPIQFGIDQARLNNDEQLEVVSRLPGPPVTWRSCQLQRRPNREEVREWKTRWNPHGQCSYPPEDELIENFRSHVFQRAQEIMGADLVRTEKFTTSIKDGVDIRDTLRHWYDGEIYVRELPPSLGSLDTAVMLFDSPADPRDYPWRTTWFAEHENESTLSFFATNFAEQMVGPGIALATYGGAMFIFPPIPIPDIWQDPRLDFCDSMEDRLIAAACLHSSHKRVALVSPLPPGAGWRRLAKRYGRSLIHIPMAQFSDQTVQQLRMVHVLNGQQVRSYAADFIRRA